MHFHFDAQKTIEAVGLILELEGSPVGRIRLLKLLYIVDRELLMESGRPLTGDIAAAMKHGPVLSHVYDLIKGVDQDDERWREHFESRGYRVLLKKAPGVGSLTKREIEKLIEVTIRYGDTTDDELSDVTHEFKEWSDNFRPRTSTLIPWRDILSKQGLDDLIPIIERDEADRRELAALFGSTP